MLKSPAEYRKLAAQCRASADRPEILPRRDMLIRIAHMWMKMAKHVEECEQFGRGEIPGHSEEDWV